MEQTQARRGGVRADDDRGLGAQAAQFQDAVEEQVVDLGVREAVVVEGGEEVGDQSGDRAGLGFQKQLHDLGADLGARERDVVFEDVVETVSDLGGEGVDDAVQVEAVAANEHAHRPGQRRLDDQLVHAAADVGAFPGHEIEVGRQHGTTVARCGTEFYAQVGDLGRGLRVSPRGEAGAGRVVLVGAEVPFFEYPAQLAAAF